MSPSSSNADRNMGGCSPSGSSSSMDEKASKVIESMLREHDENSMITKLFLPHVRARFHISGEYKLCVSKAGQRSFDPFLNGFGLLVNALKAGLRFPLHSLVVSCLRHWRVSPSQIAPNS
ncbi:hypothetical protein B296_00022171 [Ensete ventricosum]|uniref:Uncharacterized protein n=1 Tax=Ensete ventricosum TaxID=4639 RepID=A0A427AVH2_ENSVE|nr:hypothetical protein B296_00022171 [Ensete ventricosum]